ncbi:hypothetical protein HYX58_02125 [Candidatus Dependentiae bacterium]|nr:hypothetical protein [Candidatus Dependentiae bacterium]
MDSKRAIFYTSPLNKAVDLDNIEDAEKLLKEGIGANVRYPMVDNFEAMRTVANMLQNNGNANSQEKLLGVYPVQLIRSVEMLDLLMKYDACIDAATFPHSRNRNASLTALGRAIRWYHSPELVEALLERGATIIDLWEQKTYIEELADLKKDQRNSAHKAEHDKIIELLEGYKGYLPAK